MAEPRLNSRKAAESELFDELVQRLAIRAGKGRKTNSCARIVGAADLAFGLKEMMIYGYLDVDCVSHREAGAKNKEPTRAQIVRGIFDSNGLATHPDFNGLVERR